MLSGERENQKRDHMRLIIEREKIFYIILFVIISVNLWLHSTTIEINQDGTVDFTTIQEGINASIDNDTILVHPGIYFENLLIEEKNIYLTSLQIIDEDEQFIHNTILNGNQNGSVIKIDNANYGLINGFTIRNGSGFLGYSHSEGGGLRYEDSSSFLSNCIIVANQADVGGGLFIDNCTLIMKGNIIKRNKAKIFGGGILILDESEIIFDNINLNSIFFNYAGYANDIYTSYLSGIQDVIVDTFTVFEPDMYWALSKDNGGFPIEDAFNFSIQNAKIELIETDLFITPTGDDSNSGLSQDEPLQTLCYALNKIKSDSLISHTIHISNGIYSPSLNNQFFPVHLKENIKIIGESKAGVILDAENLSGHFRGHDYSRDIVIENCTLKNAEDYYCMEFVFNKNVFLNNIDIIECYNQESILLRSRRCTLYLKDVTIKESSYRFGISLNMEGNTLIENCRLYNNEQTGSALNFINLVVNGNSTTNDRLDIINTEIVNNIEHNNEWNGSGVALNMDGNSNLSPISLTCNLINSTFGNNEAEAFWGSAINIKRSLNLNIYNSIIYGNIPIQIVFDQTPFPCSLYVTNSLIEGGEEGVGHLEDYILEWDESNIDVDPDWSITDDLEYLLSENSSCIDYGTLDLPEGIELPEFDLMGNPRIFGDNIDLGAYEWNPNISISDEIIENINKYQLANYPNPFDPTTTISFILPNTNKVELSIYNIKGQKIKTIINRELNKGMKSINWDGINNLGKLVSSGTYFYLLKIEDRLVAFEKCLLLK